MELILLQKVANLGNIGDRVRVKSGYGRNHLLPKGKATLATPQNIARFEARRAELERSSARSARPISPSTAPRPVTHWRAAKCVCPPDRCARSANTPCNCICMPTSTSSCRS